MKHRYAFALLAGALALPGAAAAQNAIDNPPPCKSFETPAVTEHINKALALVDPKSTHELVTSLYIITRSNGYCAPKIVPDFKRNTTVAKPVKMFDDVYYFGDHFVGSLVIKTSAGLILFDGMNNEDEAEKIVDAGMRSVGLNPADIKHLIITHGHGDHWGGSRYFQKKYNAQIHAGPEDWKVMAKAPVGPGKPTPPDKDKDVTEGEKLTLGNTTLTLSLSPGHTFNSVSAIFPVTDNGTKHIASLLGGTGIPPFLEDDPATPKKYASVQHYIDSIHRLQQASVAAGADVAISTHPIFDGTLVKGEMVANRKGPGPNPWVIGKDGVRRYLDVHAEAAMAVQAMVEAANKK